MEKLIYIFEILNTDDFIVGDGRFHPNTEAETRSEYVKYLINSVMKKAETAFKSYETIERRFNGAVLEIETAESAAADVRKARRSMLVSLTWGELNQALADRKPLSRPHANEIGDGFIQPQQVLARHAAFAEAMTRYGKIEQELALTCVRHIALDPSHGR